MGEHRVGDVSLKRLVDEIEKRVKRPVSVPKRECCDICEAIGLPDSAVVLAEASVSVLEEERMQGSAVDAGVECLPERLVVGIQLVLPEFLFPEILGLGPHSGEVLAVQLLEVVQSTVCPYSRHSDIYEYALVFPGLEPCDGFQFLSPGLKRTAETLGVVDDRLPVLEYVELLDRP